MALRIKSHWNYDSEKSFEDIGSALAFISWRLAADRAINLHGEDYIYNSDAQRVRVIVEYLVFCVQIVDRIVYNDMEEKDRRELIISMAKNIAGHVQHNAEDLFGASDDHGSMFIQRLNERAAEYAEFNITEDGPSYPFYRHLGHVVQAGMEEVEENRWVIDQVMDKDGPFIYKELSKATRDLFE